MATTDPTYRTAEQIAASLEAAVEAVRDYLGTDREVPAAYAASDRARRAVDIAISVDGVTPAQIAARVGVRQLVIAELVADPRHRAAALAAARHDADRYAGRVMAAMQAEARWRWETAGRAHGAKRRIADDLKISRQTLDTWLADTPADGG